MLVMEILQRNDARPQQYENTSINFYGHAALRARLLSRAVPEPR